MIDVQQVQPSRISFEEIRKSPLYQKVSEKMTREAITIGFLGIAAFAASGITTAFSAALLGWMATGPESQKIEAQTAGENQEDKIAQYTSLAAETIRANKIAVIAGLCGLGIAASGSIIGSLCVATAAGAAFQKAVRQLNLPSSV